MTYSIGEKELVAAAKGLSPEERAQLTLLIETPEGAVVLDRDFGLDYSFLDDPPYLAQNKLAGALADKIPRYIPSLVLVEVRIGVIEQTGKLHIKVVIDHAEKSL